MPTGYTADIKDGISFKTFALNCARAFGACVTLRDEPGGGYNIPETFEPNDYHIKAQNKAMDNLEELNAMSIAECEQHASKAYDDAETSRVMRLKELAGQQSAYERMLEKVRAWVPPTPEHKGLHDFMIEQITKSIEFDCGTSYYETPTVRLSGDQWAAERRALLARDLAYHAEKHTDEVKRAADRTEWVSTLRNSLAA